MVAYRPDIDGLRALAVLPVVLFHAGVPGFGGGFTGVDIFFVISGYLLTGILRGELARGQFSLAGFYVRRARRILPALATVVLVCAVVGFYLLAPDHYAQFGHAVRSVATITANNHFSAIQADYWNQTLLAEQPLLHTWSLAVEEQFYLGLPLMLWSMHAIFARAGRSPDSSLTLTLASLGGVAIASLACAQWLLTSDPGGAFFLLPSRAWELLAGCLLAVHSEHQQVLTKGFPGQGIAGAAGLVMVVVAIVLFDEQMTFPGIAALVPCVGAALIIYAGIPSAQPASAVSRLLASRPLLLVGLISYSLYLWHWPVLVFARSLGWQAWSLPPLPMIVQLLAMLLLAWTSWRFVEKPFRRGKDTAVAQRRVLIVAVVVLGVGWGIGKLAIMIGRHNEPLAQVQPPVMKRLSAEMVATPGARCEGSSRTSAIRRDGGGCLLGGRGTDAPAFALVGDSHARMYTEAIEVLGRETGLPVLLLARSSCVPVLGLRPPTRPECTELTEATFDYLVRSPVRHVVLAGYWVDIAPAGRRDAFASFLDRTVGVLIGAGKRVYLMQDVPELADDLVGQKAAIKSIGAGGSAVYGPTLAEHETVQGAVNEVLRSVARKYGALLLDPAEVLCRSADGCIVADRNRTLYRDRHHLTDAAAIELRSVFRPLADEAAR